jgi:tetratricopeptide (TPR) repeat protein
MNFIISGGRLVRISGFPGVLLAAALIGIGGMQGCSSSQEGASVTGQTRSPDRDAESRARDIALQHYVNGSVHEMKGEYAEAILEYQDALRYDPNEAVYFALSKDYSALNRHTLAIETGRKAVALAPGNLDYRRNLADVYVRAYELDSAAVQFEEIVRQDSTSITPWYNLARLYHGRKPLKALKVYREIIRRFGPEWEVLLQIAELHNSLQQYDQAAGALREMLELDPGNVELKRTLAQNYVRAKQYDSALTVYKELREVQPDNIDYLSEMASVYLMKKEYAEAAHLFEVVLAQDTVSLESKLRIGEVYFGQLENDSTLVPVARSIFERIRDAHPDDWRSYWFLGAIGAVSRNDSLSIPNFRKVTELAGWNADGWVYLSSVFLEQNNFSEVVTILESALKVVPDDYRVNFFLGVAYSRLGRNDDAARVLERAHELNADDIGVMSQLALVYDNLQRHEESDRLYEEALKKDPENHLLLNNYSYSLSERRLQLNRALEMSRKAVEAQPKNSSYLDTLGWIYFQLGEYREAEKHIARAIAEGDVSAVVHEHLGDVYFMLKDRDRALEQWNIALRMDETNAELRAKIARGTL